MYSYEWCTSGVQRGDGFGEDSAFASADHCLNPDRGFEAPAEEAGLHITQRRKNLLALHEARKGIIDSEAMTEIINTRPQNGGTANRCTVYQPAAAPASRTLWLKAVYRTEWTEFDLNDFFAR